MSALFVWVIVASFWFIGLAGIFIPAVPGLPLVFAGMLLYAVITQFTTISVGAIVSFGIITLLVWLTAYLGSGLAARAGGGRGRAVIGTIIGAVLGALAGPPGIIIGAFMGAWLGAISEGQSPARANKIAVFSVLGVVGATLVQFVIGIAMIVAFLVTVFV